MSRPAPTFPFSAIVGQDDLKVALLLVAVDPLIGGVLVRGEKGTAKSTAVRGLASLLPEVAAVEGCAFGCDPLDPDAWCHECRGRARKGLLPALKRPPAVVELPVSATEDRLVGSISLEHAIKHGERTFEPGLLARANRGILYVDEVNLLDDHLVDVLLDAAAMGVNTVEREGISVTHPARFLLVGTMNPEEGEVRPQLLDRFGLCVEVEGVREPEARVEIVQRRRAFDNDPASFLDEWSVHDTALAETLVAAKDLVPSVEIPEDLLYAIASIAITAGVDGHRADTVMARAAVAHAALRGRTVVTSEDVSQVAPLVLAHRVRRRPLDDPAPSRESVQRILTEVFGAPPPGDQDLESNVTATFSGTEGEMASPTDEGMKNLADRFERVRRTASGATQRTTSGDSRGRYVRAEQAQAPSTDIALDATVRAAAPHQLGRERNGRAVAIEARDLHSKVRTRKVGATIVLCVDASGSMGATKRMQAAKGAALALLEEAHQRRDRIGMVTFRGNDAELVLAPTTSTELAALKLRELRTGGSTPLAHGVLKALDVLAAEQRRDPDTVPWLVLLTDGRANVGIDGALGSQSAVEAATRVCAAGVHALVIDTQASATTSPARDIAKAAEADYVRLGSVEPGTIAEAVRTRL